MNIRTDYLEALKRQETATKSTPASSGEGFAAVFAQQIGQPESAQSASSQVRSGSIDAPLLISSLEQESSSTGGGAGLETVTGQTSALLDSWQQYADMLAQGGSPRTAWHLLSGMDSQLQSLRGTLSEMSEKPAGMDSMMRELEILAVTEKIKLNRGDYS